MPQGSVIMSARFDPLTGWAQPAIVSDLAAGPATKPALAMERGGSAVVLFQQVPSAEGVSIVAVPCAPEGAIDTSRRQVVWKGGKKVDNLSVWQSRLQQHGAVATRGLALVAQ